MLRIPYVGICFTEEHVEKLRTHIVDMILDGMRDESAKDHDQKNKVDAYRDVRPMAWKGRFGRKSLLSEPPT